MARYKGRIQSKSIKRETYFTERFQSHPQTSFLLEMVEIPVDIHIRDMLNNRYKLHKDHQASREVIVRVLEKH